MHRQSGVLIVDQMRCAPLHSALIHAINEDKATLAKSICSGQNSASFGLAPRNVSAFAAPSLSGLEWG